MTLSSFVCVIGAVGLLLAALLFYARKSAKSELQRDILQDNIQNIQAKQKEAKQDEKDIAAMSIDDKRDELSK